jgi:toxin-antitoxin system PIN domain toxin
LIAVDTNILVYAHRQDSPWHGAAALQLRQLAEGTASWAIPWPCIHEFLAIVTHARIYAPPTNLGRAAAQADAWLQAPGVVPLSETVGYFGVLRRLLEPARVNAPKVHDARIAALCLHHGVAELWSADRDFSCFPGLRVRNPLTA